MTPRLFACILPLLLAACTGRPAYVLSDKKIEKVLFDLYLAQTEINENAAIFHNDSAKKQKLLESVFKKHKITQEKFDTSLVWYNAHIDQYAKINTRLTERYDYLIHQMQNEIEREKRRLAARIPIPFKDLKLKDFSGSSQFPWLPQDTIDLLPENPIEDLPGPFLPPPLPENATDTLPENPNTKNSTEPAPPKDTTDTLRKDRFLKIIRRPLLQSKIGPSQ